MRQAVLPPGRTGRKASRNKMTLRHTAGGIRLTQIDILTAKQPRQDKP